MELISSSPEHSPINTKSFMSETPQSSPKSLESILSQQSSTDVESEPPDQEVDIIEEDEEKLKAEEQHKMKVRFAAKNLISLIVPISLCMVVVLLMETFVKTRLHEPLKDFPITPYQTPSNIGHIAANAACVLAAIIVMTFLIVLCVKYDLVCLFYSFMSFVLALVMFMLTFIMATDIIRSQDLTLDWISVGVFIYNFGVVGMISLFGNFPDILRQFYTCITCCMIVIQYIDHFHEYTVLALLAVLVFWDVIAVLTPCGPLNMLVKLLKKKGKLKSVIPPGLVYSTMVYLMAEENSSSVRTESDDDDDDDDDDHGVHLGLGDFIFYSLLIGKSADHRLASGVIDWNTIIACYIVILIGLIGTVMFLLVFDHALPALPISLSLGLLFYFSTWFIITPFSNQLTSGITFI